MSRRLLIGTRLELFSASNAYSQISLWNRNFTWPIPVKTEAAACYSAGVEFSKYDRICALYKRNISGVVKKPNASQKCIESPSGFRGDMPCCCEHPQLRIKYPADKFEISSTVASPVHNKEILFAGIKYLLVRCAPAVECILRFPQGRQRCHMWICSVPNQSNSSPRAEVVCNRFLEACVR